MKLYVSTFPPKTPEMPTIRLLAYFTVGTDWSLTLSTRLSINDLSLMRVGNELIDLRIWLNAPTKIMKTMLRPRVISFHLKMSLSSSF